MESSPQGREICTLDGNAGAIISRGNEIATLGEQMISSASMLKSIADGASGQMGLAVDKLKEVVGDCYEELDLAGKRYKPTGPVLVTYGNVVSEVQPLIKTAVENCKADWKTYQSKQNSLFDARIASYPTPVPTEVAGGADPVDPRQEAVDDAQALAAAAYDDWTSEARIFDNHYDTWEAAFNKAADEIGEATDGGIEDSKWDDLDGFVAGALEVLKWVGLALAVLGVIIGGPFIAAIAAIAAIATLLLTIYSFSRGNSSGWDLAFAVVGIIPFGSMGKLFSGNKVGFLHDMAGGLTSAAGRADIVGDFAAMGRGFSSGFAGQGGNLARVFQGFKGGVADWASRDGAGLSNIISRLFAGKSADQLFDPATLGSAAHGLDGLSITLGAWQTQLGHVQTMVGYLEPSK